MDLFLYETRIVSTAYCAVMTKIIFQPNGLMVGQNNIVGSLIISAFDGNTVRLVAQLLSNTRRSGPGVVRRSVSGGFAEIEMRQPPLARCPVTKLALRRLALKLTKLVFWRDIGDKLVLQPNPPIPKDRARFCHWVTPARCTRYIESKHQHGNAIRALMRINRWDDALQCRPAVSKNLRTEAGTSSYSR
jgi:hypothetical protein